MKERYDPDQNSVIKPSFDSLAFAIANNGTYARGVMFDPSKNMAK